MEFRRALSSEEILQWETMMTTIKDIRITEGADKVKLVLEKSGQYTTRSMYRMLAHRGDINYRMRKIWGCKLPLKLKVFMWLIMQIRLQTSVNLKGRKWKGNVPETIDHIFFSCINARFTWTCIKEALSWDRTPTGLQDFLDNWAKMGGRNLNVVIFCLAIVLWGLWTTRNRYTILL